MKLLSAFAVNPRIAAAPAPLFAPPATLVTTPGMQPDLMAWARRIVEKIKSSNVRWVPWLDDLTEETDTQRSFYRPMLREPMVKAALATKVYAVAALGTQTHPAEKTPRDKEGAECLKFALGKIKGDTREIAVKTLFPGLFDGCSICEPVWDTQPFRKGRWAGKRGWRDYKSKDINHLRIDVDAYKNITGVRTMEFNDGKVIPPNQLVIWSHMSFFENPQGMSDLRAAYRDWWLKQQALHFRGLALERFSLPWLKGTYTSNDQKAALEVALEEARGGTFINVPTGVLVEAVDMGMRGTADFQSAIDNLDRGILIAIMGAYLQVLEGQVTDGRGDTSEHRQTSELFQWMLAAALGDVISRQMVPLWYEINYPDLEPARVTWGGINETAIGQWLDNKLKIQQLGGKVSAEEVDTYTSNQPPADDADTLQPPALAGAMLPPFGSDVTTDEPQPKYIDEAIKSLGIGAPPADPLEANQDAALEGEPTDAANALRATVGGSQAIAALQKSYYARELPRDAVIANAQIIFGLSPLDAEQLFPPLAPDAPQALEPIEPQPMQV